MEIIAKGSSPISISGIKGEDFNQEFNFPGAQTLYFTSAKIVRLWGDESRPEDVMVDFVSSPANPGDPGGAVYGTPGAFQVILFGGGTHFAFEKGKYLFFMRVYTDGKYVDCIENSYYIHE